MIKTIDCNINYDRVRNKSSLYQKDLKCNLKSCTPGQWCFFIFNNKSNSKEKRLGMVNTNVLQGPEIRFIDINHQFETELEYLDHLIKKAIFNRSKLYENIKSKRLIYGDSDNLPGLIVDQYENCVLIQINSAGLDQFRNEIKEIITVYLKRESKEESTSSNVFFFDHEIYRRNEGLVQHEAEQLPKYLEVIENKLRFIIPRESVQKIGFYFDHRENRNKLANFLKTIDISFIKKSVDLFCYAGGWGLNALKSGVQEIDFVDQGNFGEIIANNLKINNFENMGTFIRSDVFKFLDQTDQKYQLIISDPPAFSKSVKSISKAKLGYQKLFDKVFKIMDTKCLWALGSCTHGISFKELSDLALTRANKANKQIQLLDLGVQGHDHPFSSLSDHHFYIKYILYYVEENVRCK